MIPTKKYGVVYTPNRLADFVASLIRKEADKDNYQIHTVLDPACGEGALLEAMKRTGKRNEKYYGIDIDKKVISNLSVQNDNSFEFICKDAILPPKIKGQAAVYWRKKFPNISAIIANPPWSSEKIYDRQQLSAAGFKMNAGQYDSYVLFLELAYEICDEGGYFGFIIPDSLFESQNENLRRFLAEKTQIRVIARLGEKIFEEVNRATTVIICKKAIPAEDDVTMCFRLNTDQRKQFLTSDIYLETFYDKEKHPVKQARFISNDSCSFDVDTRSNEEDLLAKIRSDCIDWEETFIFGRGVEISKKGGIARCPMCGHAQGYTKAQFAAGNKKCVYCNEDLPLNDATLKSIVQETPFDGCERILVGEHVKRYRIIGESFIELNIPGINYKNENLYIPPKLLIRKTGLGIYSCVDYSGGLTSQTVYIIRYKQESDAPPLEYYLALLNSRVVYYYYLKVYGENEWKSHPYFTKKIIFSLPLKAYTGDELDKEIIGLAKALSKKYSYETDLELEGLVMRRYNINPAEHDMIAEEMRRLPDLSAVNGMKF
ncbi:N-6 DNA methylase [Propionispora hippei]|uniref:TaqI-like C-terminal specificity domain-containing protein n=1 Tax=Propionispora hippei DSM 15287 TaxID=1123003 RepID=A0A1M6GNI9_9FIRM|nr:N-6 DNA methylase [Propionispora hippei]SHJ11436.1 TaqI-like C-terminal specificity domain-containing protein [Propionispora hippei DSM 15287]